MLPADPFQKWFHSKGWTPHPYQLELLKRDDGRPHDLLIAPTGGGKTLAGFLPTLVPLSRRTRPGLHTLYVSPLKALAAGGATLRHASPYIRQLLESGAPE